LVKKRRGIFGERYVLTAAGTRQLEERRREINGRLQNAAQLRKTGRELEAQRAIDELLPVLPILVGLGVVSLALWKLLIGHLPVAEE
jgi:hypothetical protein